MHSWMNGRVESGNELNAIEIAHHSLRKIECADNRHKYIYIDMRRRNDRREVQLNWIAHSFFQQNRTESVLFGLFQFIVDVCNVYKLFICTSSSREKASVFSIQFGVRFVFGGFLLSSLINAEWVLFNEFFQSLLFSTFPARCYRVCSKNSADWEHMHTTFVRVRVSLWMSYFMY